MSCRCDLLSLRQQSSGCTAAAASCCAVMAVNYAAKRKAPTPLEWQRKQNKSLKTWEQDFPSRHEETREEMGKIL